MTSNAQHSVVLLSRALDQAGDALAAVHQEQLPDPTPCASWDVAHLIGHLLGTPGKFAEQLQGGQPDWAAAPEPATHVGASDFRAAADDLIHLWHQAGDEADPGAVDGQTAEFALHTWDLVRATGQSRRLDPDVAEQALAFMSQALTPERRGEAFGAERDAPPDADPYERLAAFAGRDLTFAGQRS